jgi:hypothetical protein
MSRPALRPESLRDTSGTAVRRRRRNNDDVFAIPKELRQEGVSYEWKRESCLGEETPMYMSGLKANGWEEVSLAEMPCYGRQGETGVVRINGQVLMKRPTELTIEARVENYEEARDRVLSVSKRMSADVVPGLPRFNDSRVSTTYKDEMPADARIVKTATTQLTLDD